MQEWLQDRWPVKLGTIAPTPLSTGQEHNLGQLNKGLYLARG